MKLFNVREKRIKPQKDDKTILSWNALSISAFIKGYRVTGNELYLNTAVNAIKFIETKTKSSDGSLHRIYKNNLHLKSLHIWMIMHFILMHFWIYWK